ncbi:hypothetical protein ACROAE_07205 [Shewanella sp. MF05960]|uniref:hypothetical protein n=1 Tax=Shewanella sp. MF05960 TaxID=3434874 RepID=UPI003D7B9B08
MNTLKTIYKAINKSQLLCAILGLFFFIQIVSVPFSVCDDRDSDNYHESYTTASEPYQLTDSDTKIDGCYSLNLIESEHDTCIEQCEHCSCCQYFPPWLDVQSHAAQLSLIVGHGINLIDSKIIIVAKNIYRPPIA